MIFPVYPKETLSRDKQSFEYLCGRAEMGKTGDIFLGKSVRRSAIPRVDLPAENANHTSAHKLRHQTRPAKNLRGQLDFLIHAAKERRTRPAVISNNFPKPHNADWSWRPEIWRDTLEMQDMSDGASTTKLGKEIKLFHDGTASDLTLHHLGNRREKGFAPCGLRFDVLDFRGSFLSLAMDLPKGAVNGLKRNHILRVALTVEVSYPLAVFARLNIRHGPNTEQILRAFPMGQIETIAEFDLAYADLHEKRIESAWVDLIFEAPRMTQITLRDLTFSRRPRAQL